MPNRKITREDKLNIRAEFRRIYKEGRLRKPAIHTDLAGQYGISANYCANIIRAKRVC